jgi:hypothetical protein
LCPSGEFSSCAPEVFTHFVHLPLEKSVPLCDFLSALAAGDPERWPQAGEVLEVVVVVGEGRCYFLLEMSSGKVTAAHGVRVGVWLLQTAQEDNMSPAFSFDSEPSDFHMC